jgi:ATP-dependent protease HslVU (ClpYQ) peptidase subunit
VLTLLSMLLYKISDHLNRIAATFHADNRSERLLRSLIYSCIVVAKGASLSFKLLAVALLGLNIYHAYA